MSSIAERLRNPVLYFPKILGQGYNSLKIIKDGIEMSLGSNDNAGSSDVCVRTSIAFYNGDMNSDIIKDHPLVMKYGDPSDGTIDCWNDPEMFARVLGEFLGFEMIGEDEDPVAESLMQSARDIHA